jgi:3-hydroxyacyl-CoA dehydrogenase
LHDARFGAGDEARENIRKNLARQVAKAKLSATDAEAALHRITTVVTLPTPALRR